MGFDCIICKEREIWAFESKKYARICMDCEKKYTQAYLDSRWKEIFQKYSNINFKKVGYDSSDDDD